MPDEHLGPLVSGDQIKSELRHRKKKDVYKTVSGSSKRLIAQKVKLEEAEGWRVYRRNAKSTRMAKEKPADEQLEDEVWSILAQMGFKEMSKGRQFKISVGEGLPPRQIDVLAKDNETAVIVECTRRDEPGRRRMAHLIDKIRAHRGSLIGSVHKTYSRQPKLKVKFVIATRKIAWSDADIQKCMEADIALIADGELDYYSQLTKHLKSAARYQFLAHLFSGQKIEGLTNRVMATRGKMGDHTFFTFLIRPDELLKIAYVGHKASRDIDSLETYQRMLQPIRLKKIAGYINDGGKFPTNIVVNLKTPKRNRLRFDAKEKYGEGTLGELYLPPTYASAWIIDGQHRLYGYAYARAAGNGFNQDSTLLPVLAFEDLPADEEMNLFIDINSKQVKVRNNLLVELYSDLHWQSPNPGEAFQALLSRIAARLNNEGTSPLNNRMVVSGKRKTSSRCLTQTSIQAGLREAKLLGTYGNGAITPGPLSTARKDDYQPNLRKSVTVLSDCLRLFSTNLPDHWKLGDHREENLCGYLCTNIGIRAMFLIIKDIADHIEYKDSIKLCYFDAEETFAEIRPYLQVLVDHFENATAQDFLRLRLIGSSLASVRRQAYEMEVVINRRIPEFNPTGLQEYRDSRDEAGTQEASNKVREIEQRLFNYVIGTLQKQYGTNNEEWWVQGIPTRIRQDCSTRWEARNREGDVEQELYLINYIDICHNNWELFKDVISLGQGDTSNKKKMTRWIKDLNDVRNRTAHPAHGVLNTKQVARVNELHSRVTEHFPQNIVAS